MTIDTSKKAVAAILEGVTLGPWRRGDASYSSIVADHQTGFDDNQTIHGYGGHLLCESVKMEANQNFIIWCREGVPALSSDLEAMRARVEELTVAMDEIYDNCRNSGNGIDIVAERTIERIDDIVSTVRKPNL